MFLNKLFAILLMLVLSGSWVWAENHTNETSEEASATTEEAVQSEVADEGAVKVETILINDFEDADRWFGGMSIDSGLIQVEKRKGAALEVRQSSPERSRFVLGAKINFFNIGYAEASIEPPNPIIIPGYTKKLSVWAYGRGFKHVLSAVVRDFKGRVFKFKFGELSYTGWKKLETDIPSDPSWPFFSQIDNDKKTFFQTHGVTFLGFMIDFNPDESNPRFYVYLDNLEAESNIYLYEKELELARIPEDERLEPLDDW